jgi:hypothetical protein
MLRALLTAAAAGSLLFSSAFAVEGLVPASDSAGGLSPGEIARLIEQLDAPEFGQRQEASHRLSEVGKSALPEIEKAVTAPSREVSGRALDILKLHFQRGEADLKQAAKESLTRLAASKNESLSQRAHSVIDPPKDWSYGNQFGMRGPGWIAPAVVPPPATQTISISDINGHREVRITDDARVIKMQTWPTGRIEIEIEEKLPGRQGKKIQAKDLEDLKAKDADVAQLYEQYQQRGRAPIGGLFGGPAIPAIRGPAIPAPNDAARRMLETIESNLQLQKGRLRTDPNAQKQIDSLERTRQQLRNLLPPGGALTPPKPIETAQRPVVR